jgi:hypothetical protein
VPGPAAGAVRPPLPVRRHLRPAVRAGVQRRAHGEPGRRHVLGDVRLPLAHTDDKRRSGRWSSRTRWRTCGSATS